MSSNELFGAERSFSPLLVQVFPHAGKSLMSRGAALHLYRLLQQYGWCLSVVDYASRWTGFWPRLKPVERVVLIYTVKAHCDGEFGRRVVVSNLPVDFEFFESDTRPAELTDEVQSEFECLLEGYCAKVGGNQQIREWVEKVCPAEYQEIDAAGAMDRVFGNNAWVCPDQLGARSAILFRELGFDERWIAQACAAIEKALFGFYEGFGVN
jgi:hypothetical protein